jgi:hypothetical protein
VGRPQFESIDRSQPATGNGRPATGNEMPEQTTEISAEIKIPFLKSGAPESPL